MFKKIMLGIKSFIDGLTIATNQFKHQSAFEINNITPCSKTGRHQLEVKLTGKSQSTPYFAEEIVVDKNFLLGFSSSDISTITYLATADRYEALLLEERIKKSYELIRNPGRQGKKQMQLRNKLTNESRVIPLGDFADHELLDHLTSQDAYYLGYLAGQEQSWKDFSRLKIISSDRNINE